MRRGEEMREAAEPGPWRGALDALAAEEKAHRATWAEHAAGYGRYYDAPEPMRASLGDGPARSALIAEESAAALARAREALAPARDAAFVAEASRLGAASHGVDAPAWALLLRDLHALRAWRVARLDGIDARLPPLLLRKPEKGLLDRAVAAWCKASGHRQDRVRGRLAELAAAGLVPDVDAAIDGGGPPMDAERCRRLDGIAGREGAEALAEEVEAAIGILPGEAFPPPDEALGMLRGRGAGPGL